MGHSADHIEDFVVDMVLDVDSRGIDIEALARRIRLPGLEVHRSSARGTIWLTALVTAGSAAAAIRAVREGVLDQLPATLAVTTVATTAPLGVLYARLGEVLSDDQLGAIDLRDLVEQQMWDRPEVDVRELDLRPAFVGSIA